jgi:hypothetical protein
MPLREGLQLRACHSGTGWPFRMHQFWGKRGRRFTGIQKCCRDCGLSRSGGDGQLYRICLQKHEDAPMKAKENCGMYKEAIRDLAPDNMRTVLAEVLDRLRDKSTINETTTRP